MRHAERTTTATGGIRALRWIGLVAALAAASSNGERWLSRP
jgi:hypothetical protein